MSQPPLTEPSPSPETPDRETLYGHAFLHASEALVITDHNNCIIDVNPAFTRLTGYRRDEAIGFNPRILASGRTSPEQYAMLWQSLLTTGSWEGEIWDRRKDGTTYPKHLRIAALRDENGRITHYLGSFNDLSASKEAAEKLRHLATHDVLTGLPNRLALDSALRHALNTCRRDQALLAVLLIDLDRFKTINDTLGHHIGDGLLVGVAQRLRESTRSSDIVARLGGDEFVVILPNIEQPMTAANVASKIQHNLGDGYRVEEHDLYTTPSIGISIFPHDGEDAETLMKHADTAMYHAKGAGRANHQFYTPQMNQAAAERLQLETALRQALGTTHLASSQFSLHFQPLIRVKSGDIIGLEALARWQHPLLGSISPTRFIPLAEETGLIQPLGDWVFWEACRHLNAFHRAGLDGLRIAVNLSSQQLRHEGLPAVVRGALECYELSPCDLELEITESTAMQNPEVTLHVLSQLSDMGIILAIDDFGTGYSSLSYLKNLPIHRLKLDKSFVQEVDTDKNDAAICSATVALGHNLGLELVAEGVETTSQRDFLARMGCDVVQGFLYCHPLPAEEIIDFVKNTRRQTAAFS